MDDRFGEVEELATGLLGVASEHVEGLLVVDRMGRHQDAFGTFDHRATGEGAFEETADGALGSGAGVGLAAGAGDWAEAAPRVPAARPASSAAAARAGPARDRDISAS